MQEEGGITKVSLSNIRELAQIHGIVKLLYHSPYPDPDDPFTEVHFSDGFIHKCTGFATGYSGEGPTGLSTACKEFLNRTDITPEIVRNLKNSNGVCYLFTRGNGNGESLTSFPGVMDCEFDVEVF